MELLDGSRDGWQGGWTETQMLVSLGAALFALALLQDSAAETLLIPSVELFGELPQGWSF